MTVLLWCVVAACVLPYLAHAIKAFARLKSEERYDNRHPRDRAPELRGWARRAWFAEQNLFEGLPVFIGFALVAHVAGADPTWSGILGLVWVGARLSYIGAYVANIAVLRSALFGVSTLCLTGLAILAGLGGSSA